MIASKEVLLEHLDELITELNTSSTITLRDMACELVEIKAIIQDHLEDKL